MLDAATQKKYFGILMKGNTLKLDASDAIELVEKYDDLVWEDQLGNSTRSDNFKAMLSKISGKIIMHFFTLYHNGEKKIMYWCPCSIDDIVTLAGGTNFNEESGVYDSIEWISREDQISFLGKDIKKSCLEDKASNSQTKYFFEKYANSDHPIADNIFYTIYIKKFKEEQSINCARNTTLSPRPEKKEEAK